MVPRSPPRTGPAPDEEDPLVLLERAARLVLEGAEAALRERKLSRVHQRVLTILARQGELRVGALVEALGISKQAAHPTLTLLLERGLVRARVPPESRRVKLLSLTPAGARLEAQLAGPLRRRLEAALRGAGPGAEATWRGVMQRLVR